MFIHIRSFLCFSSVKYKTFKTWIRELQLHGYPSLQHTCTTKSINVFTLTQPFVLISNRTTQNYVSASLLMNLSLFIFYVYVLRSTVQLFRIDQRRLWHFGRTSTDVWNAWKYFWLHTPVSI
jgi:hypothetical protein